MHQHLPSALLIAAAAIPVVRAQSPAFEVATIKQNRTDSQNISIRAQPGGRVVVTNNTLYNMIRNTYRLQGFQVVGGPEWIRTDRWDIVAKAEGNAEPQVMLEMLKTLLADRFKVVVHRENRDMPIFALVVARPDGRLGPKVQPSTIDCAAIMAGVRARGGAPPQPPGGGPLCGTRVNGGRLMTSAATMADLSRSLSPIAGRSVIDKTGLTGNFDLELTWTPEEPAGPGDGTAAGDAVSLFTAIQEQLGLKLDPQRGPVDTLVIDSAERPVED